MHAHPPPSPATVLLPALLLLQAAAAAQSPAAPPKIERLVVSPRERTVTVGDTVRFTAVALDAAGAPVPGARILWRGSAEEGGLDSAGVLVASARGTMPVTVTAVVPGQRPVIERFDVRMVAGPAVRVEVAPAVPVLVVGQRLRMSAAAYSRQHDLRDDRVQWTSSAPRVLSVDADGVVRALAPGQATLVATAGAAKASHPVRVVANTIASVELTPARPAARTGDVVRFRAVAKDARGREIAGLTPTWSFSPGQGQIDADGLFVGYEPGSYTVTASFGAQGADAVVNLAPRDARRAASVVGRLPRTAFTTAEVWLHPTAKVAYLGTHGGGDRLYTIDIANPAAPVIVDSVQADTRLVNDVMTTADGKHLVFTREGASSRKNGIVIASLEDPLRPKVIAEFTEGVTAGVHSAFVYTQPTHGTHVYLTNDGTGAVHVVDINDPAKPKTAAVWKTDRPDPGRYVHDIDVRDGLLYASYWNDGLVILDVGNGIRGGSPSNPQLVSVFKYDLDRMYRDVEVSSGTGFTRGTHTAWRHKDYVFIADEVYRASPVKGAKDAAADRMYGRLQVIDVSDVTKPKAVAWYEPEYGGVHNVWVAGDTLYMGAYNGGFRAFDVSGELRGDLRAQGREIAHVNTADMDGNVKNAAMTWGVIYRDGLAYVNDFNNGLWIVRIEPRGKVVP